MEPLITDSKITSKLPRDLFLREIESSGYGEFMASFSPLRIGTHAWASAVLNAPTRIKLLVEFLALGAQIPLTTLNECLPSFSYLIESGLAEIDVNSNVYIAGLSLVTAGGLWIWVQRPCINPTVYIGHDTAGLMYRLRSYAGATALDLCAGPGTQGLYLASRGCTVTAIERNVVAVEIAEQNARLNGLDEKFKILVGDLYEVIPSDHEKFDFISANPPLLPFPQNHFYPFVGHGGGDGLAVTWRILEGLPKWLKPTGIGRIIGTCISDGLLPVELEGFRASARRNKLDLLITIVGHAPFTEGTFHFESLIDTSVGAGAIATRNEISRDLALAVSQRGGSHICYFSMMSQLGSGTVTVMDLANEKWEELWFV